MSNDVEILCLDGPKHGMMVQTPRGSVPVDFEAYVDAQTPEATYIPRVVVIGEDSYRIALHDGSEFSDDTINMHIVAFGLQPSWDLNRVQQVPA